MTAVDESEQTMIATDVEIEKGENVARMMKIVRQNTSQLIERE